MVEARELITVRWKVDLPNGWQKAKVLVPLALAYVGAHAIAIYFGLPNALRFSYPFMIVVPLFAAAACVWRAHKLTARLRLSWLMIALSMAIWSIAMLTSALEYFSVHAIGNLAGLSDLLFLLYAVPILLVLSSSMEGERPQLFSWLDALQAICAGCLIYALVFARLPFQHDPPVPISIRLVVTTYNIANFLLAFAATLRLFLHSSRREEGRMYRMLTGYLWIYAVAAAVNNYMVAKLGDQTGFVDLLADPAVLVLSVSVFVVPLWRGVERRAVSRRKPVARYIDNASPIVYTTTLLFLSAISIRQHFYLGMVGISLALAVYSIRSTVLQSLYLKSEQSLREAMSQLEELSLLDGLTGVANRRCFDMKLEREWNGANERGLPLAVMLIDLDHFKNLNDKYGHRMGDACLVQVAAALRQALPRQEDLLARYGGEEFAAVLADTDRAGAETVALRMRQVVRDLQIENATAARRFATVSIGVSTYLAPQMGALGDLVEAADRALYQATQRGRDRVEYMPILALAEGVAKEDVAGRKATA